ncbi:DUF2510 domain-containing protein [Gordonia zhenghanii]|nr:DUF2510 domain-containing protein [Gordonia zhenghanii]
MPVGSRTRRTLRCSGYWDGQAWTEHTTPVAQ